MTIPLVSIIIPVYNRKNVIEGTIESVLNQTYKNYELIVIDDGSTDGSADWVIEHFPNILLIRLSKNCGAAVARNEGIKLSKGEFIAFLDSDDKWSPSYLEEQVKSLQLNPKAVLSFCSFTIIQNGKKRYVNTEPKSEHPSLIYDLLIGYNCIETMSIVVVRRNILLNEYPLNEKLRISEDRELYLRLLYHGEFIHTPRNLVSKYINSDNLGLDYKLLGKTLMLLLKIFFSDKRSKPYRHLKYEAKRNWAFIVSDCARAEHDRLFAFKMNLIAIYFSLFNLKNAKNLTKRLFKDFLKFIPQRIKAWIDRIISRINVRRFKELKTPTSIIYFITNHCNARCKHCFYWRNLNNLSDEMNLEQIRKLAISLKHPADIGLTGGEPFLRKDLLGICKIFSKCNNSPSIQIPTNGLLPELIARKCEDILEQCKIHSLTIVISLDGLEETHEKIRGVRGGFNKAIETIIRLRGLKEKYYLLNLVINTVIMKHNYDEIESLIRFTQRFKIPHKFSIVRGAYSVFHLDAKISSGFNPEEEKDKILPFNKVERIYEKICNLNDSLEYKFLSKSQKDTLKLSLNILKAKRNIIPCFAGNIDGVIYPNGDVSLCEYTKPVGNLKEVSFDLHKLWNSKKANDVRNKIRKCECIHGCNLSTSLRVLQGYRVK